MNFILIVVLSSLPALFWMWWYYRKDKFEKEPLRLLALVFLLTIPFSVLCGLIEFAVNQNYLRDNSTLPMAILFYFGVVGVLEEGAKFFVVRVIIYHRPEFNEPVDGIIYAAAAALGFATLENFFYLIGDGLLIILLRGPISTLGHVLFSAMWGAALGVSKFEPDPKRRRVILAKGLGLSIVIHGGFDVLISLGKYFPDQGWLALFAIPFLGILYLIVSRQISYALKISSFNPRNRIENQPSQNSKVSFLLVPNPNSYQFISPAPELQRVNPGFPTPKICKFCGFKIEQKLNPDPFNNCPKCGDKID